MNSEALSLITALVDPETKTIIDSLMPYLPAMKRCGKTVFGQIVDALGSQDWERINRELYAHMTEDERDKLSSQVLTDARQAVKRAYETKRTYKTDLLKAVLGIAIALV